MTIYADNVCMRDLHKNHKKTITTVIIACLVLFAGTSAGMLLAVDHSTKPDHTKTAAAEKQQPAAVQTATTIRFTGLAGKTVLEQLRQTAGDVTVKDSSYGPYVEAINGLKGGTDNKYWTYYVNGQMANIGAGEYTTTGGEEVVWKFE